MVEVIELHPPLSHVMAAQALVSSTTAPPRLQHRPAGGKVSGLSPLKNLLDYVLRERSYQLVLDHHTPA